ncbi:periplasmic binding protein/LacI transcriptional regulator [Candidatus Moduliflexus flocculans]|uniref:Periplasmic binding protein/LacI transcriptional regulator n=1 Tax=Candidatus Moduliflexus flocculans TaxID=1499966 RepID=A0A0S6VTW6_9BACT|nr:periplasmic binding protein/LacI transcriptional regulator [Candidatus Moduliflexus flocculans]
MKKIGSLMLLIGMVAWGGIARAENVNIVVIPKGSDHVFWDFIRAGVDQAVKEIGNINLTWRGPAYNDDTPSQIKIVELYTKPEINAMIIVPTDKQALVEPIKKATELGIKVIVIDSGLDGHYHLSFIGTNNLEGGVLAAKRLAALINEQGKVMVLRTVPGSASTDQRAEGFLQEMKNYPNITVVADEYGGGSSGKSYHAAKKLLGEQADLQGVFAVNESSTDGMLKALREAGLAQKVKFVGFDASDPLIDGLAKKDIDALVIQNPRQMGYMGIKTAVAAIRNETVEPLVYTNVVLATPENYQTPDIHALLYP